MSGSCIIFSICSMCGYAKRFPDKFYFGAATSSYQIEGAWNIDGKGENIWDHLTHTNPSVVSDHSNGDIATDSYKLYKRDVEMMRELGLDFYRFSLSWSRILPTGFNNKINQAGVDYYNNLINEMLKYNIQPVVTLFYWDLPQSLQDLGGFASPLIMDWFGDYAQVAFEQFGDRVKYWITMNEPREICYHGYGWDTLAPQVNLPGVGDYICAKNLLLAHAKAWHIYNNNFRSVQNGIIGITIDVGFYEPETESEGDLFASEISAQFQWGYYVHPIFSREGNYPPLMIERVAAKSAQQGYAKSRLPELNRTEIDYIKGTSDFFGLNHYTSSVVYLNYTNNERVVPSFYDDIDVGEYVKEEWGQSASWWLRAVPEGFYKTLMKIKEEYDNPPIFVTENGFSTRKGINDQDRIDYLRSYLGAMLNAMEDGCHVWAYTVWSLMDNFEWIFGYEDRFGLYEVDFNSTERTRTPRKSAFVYKEIIRSHNLDFDFEPTSLTMTIDSN